jgi:hypothetical protein
MLARRDRVAVGSLESASVKLAPPQFCLPKSTCTSDIRSPSLPGLPGVSMHLVAGNHVIFQALG